MSNKNKALTWSFFVWLIGGIVWGWFAAKPNESCWDVSGIAFIVLFIIGFILNFCVQYHYGVVNSEEKKPAHIDMYLVGTGLLGSLATFPSKAAMVMVVVAFVVGAVFQLWKPVVGFVSKLFKG